MGDPEFRNRDYFAEMAEAIQVSTDCVLAAAEVDGDWLVLYTDTPDTDENTWIEYALLRRRRDGVLRIQEERAVCRMGQFKGDMEELMRRATDT